MEIKQRNFDTYVNMARNSIGTEMFRSYFSEYDGELKDGLNNGELSCAFFVSSVLKIWSAIDKPHATVAGTVQAMADIGWQPASLQEMPEDGDVLIYEPIVIVLNTKPNAHMAIYIGNEEAVSTNWKIGSVVRHNWQFKDSGGRKITAIYRGKHLIPDFIKQIKE